MLPSASPARLLAAALWPLIIVWAILLALPVQASQSQMAGQVTLVIGQSSIDRQPVAIGQVSKGDSVQPGDIIRTGANGHVHIRFVDGALVSVRPNSVLTIQEFRYNPAAPADSVVRLNLDRGEVRSISGAAAEAAKDRFRLNTPLVAIGVKGTDFVTQSTPEATRVVVNQGAIVMAPFDAGCQASGLGVCSTPRARELSGDMAGMVLIYKTGFVDPALQYLPGQNDLQKTHPGERQSIDSLKSSTVNNQMLEELLPQTNLKWGRWSKAPQAGDALTIAFRDAMQGREVTVGDGYYFLFRDRSALNALPNLNHQADFSLQGSAAQYRDPGNTVHPASVDGGSLRVDFANRTFSTSLQVSAQGIAPQSLSYTGKVDPLTGVFISQGGTGKAAGALTLNGLQGGYFFSQPLSNYGNLSGAILWGR